MMPLLDVARDLDLSRARQVIDLVRKRWFNIEIPTADGIVVDVSYKNLEVELRNRFHFEETQTAYYYIGEKANLRRAEGYDTIEGQNGERTAMMELHPRLFPVDIRGNPQTFVQVHYEASRVESPDAHIAEHGMSWAEGIDRFTEICDALEYDYEVVSHGDAHHPSPRP